MFILKIVNYFFVIIEMSRLTQQINVFGHLIAVKNIQPFIIAADVT